MRRKGINTQEKRVAKPMSENGWSDPASTSLLDINHRLGYSLVHAECIYQAGFTSGSVSPPVLRTTCKTAMCCRFLKKRLRQVISERKSWTLFHLNRCV